MRNRKEAAGGAKPVAGAAQPVRDWGKALMRSIFISTFAVLVLAVSAAAKEPLPNAPSAVASLASADAFVGVESSTAVAPPKVAEAKTKSIDAKFLSLALISTGSTFADSYTTLFARENWLAGKQGVCNMEVESAYLYGTHPTVGRAYAVASVKSAASVFSAFYLRKHHSKFWSLPLVANSVESLQGVTQNMRTCN